MKKRMKEGTIAQVRDSGECDRNQRRRFEGFGGSVLVFGLRNGRCGERKKLWPITEPDRIEETDFFSFYPWFFSFTLLLKKKNYWKKLLM